VVKFELLCVPKGWISTSNMRNIYGFKKLYDMLCSVLNMFNTKVRVFKNIVPCNK